MEGKRYTVGELARATGLTVRTLHHYDRIGLLQPTDRSPSGYRLYGREDVRRLYRILALRQLGLGLKDIDARLGQDAAAPGTASRRRRRVPRALRDRVRARHRPALRRPARSVGRGVSVASFAALARVDDDLVDLGLHSLLALQAVARAEEHGLELDLTTTFECRTVAELARRLTRP